MACARIRINCPGLTDQELQDRIMGKGLEGTSIFNMPLEDQLHWSVAYDDEHGKPQAYQEAL